MDGPCYALKLYSYEPHYRQYEEVVAVSFDSDKLRSYYEKADHPSKEAPLIDSGHRDQFICDEQEHWVIEEIPFLP